MTTLKEKLEALSVRQGHYGLLEIRDVLTMLELRDEKIKEMREILRLERRRANE